MMEPYCENLEQYSKPLFFFVTYERAQKARVLHYAGLERLAIDKHSSLLGQFESYDDNKGL